MANDPHTLSKPDQVIIEHIDLDLVIDFDQKQISGTAAYKIRNLSGADRFVLDTNNLQIRHVRCNDQSSESAFRLHPRVAHLGQALEISILPTTEVVTIEYATTPDSGALQWLDPAQTRDQKYPFFYTQSQAILARTWIPCQDTPSVRMTYNARVRVPSELLAVMSAENPIARNESGVYQFRMPQPIPSYLLALAVGDVEFRSTGERTGVYAERSLVDKAAWEFAQTPKMMETIEALYGPYRWGRYDILVLPPSFPWGGMENPRLTFVTPVLIAGDRSLVATIAHELAHSWSGNLVTNASWNDFWLNEGFTNYLTHRIMEALYGEDYGNMLSVLSMQDLQREVRELGAQSPDTHLKLSLEGRDPEEGVTAIAYEKGEFFLRTLETAVGRPRFDSFLKQYFQTFAFQSIDTERFIRYLEEQLPESRGFNVTGWIYNPGIPQNIIGVRSNAFQQVELQLGEWMKGKPAKDLSTAGWTTHHWIHFIRNLPLSLTQAQLSELNEAFDFRNSKNAEIKNEWLQQVIARNYQPDFPEIEKFLSAQGRRKYVKLIMSQLARTPDGKQMAREIFERVRPLYHTLTREVAERVLR